MKAPRPVYERDGVALYCGDAREIVPLLGRPDAVITDPPFSAVTHDGARANDGRPARPGRAGILRPRKIVTFESFTPEDLRAVLSLLRPNRWCVASIDWAHALPLRERPPEGLRFVRLAAWLKTNGTPQLTGDRPTQGWEAIAILHADAPGRMRWNGGGRSANYTGPRVHRATWPTEKPEGLIRHLVGLFTDPGETVLDPFAGSGVTLAVAHALGRKAIGIEIDPAACEVAIARLRGGAMKNEPGRRPAKRRKAS